MVTPVGRSNREQPGAHTAPLTFFRNIPSAAEQRVAADKVVAITYSLSTNGVVRHVRSAIWGDKALEYLHGRGNIIPGLERALEGREAGERFTVVIPPAEAYGERDKALQHKLPKAMFASVGRIEAGMRLVAQSEEGGPPEILLVTDVDEEDDTVLVDANHPLAGLSLEFEVHIEGVRDASDEELARGYVNPPGDP